MLRASARGENTKAGALRYGVSESWVRRVKQEYREQGKTAAEVIETIQDAIRAHAEETKYRRLNFFDSLVSAFCSKYFCAAIAVIFSTINEYYT